MEKKSKQEEIVDRMAEPLESFAEQSCTVNNEVSAFTDCTILGPQSINEKVFGNLQIILNNYIKQYP